MPAQQALAAVPSGATGFVFTDADFDRIRRLIKAQTGIHLSDAKRSLVYSRLGRRLRALGLADFASYYALVERDAEELVRCINAITTNLTAFFREPHHFEFLANQVLPELKRRHAQDRRIRIWSAGCSTGEEPYSIAMVVREVMGAAPGWDIKILATDLDSDVVARAAEGVYELERVAGMDETRKRRWLRRGRGANAGRVRIAPEVRELITFRQLNLMHPWPMRGPFDVIFCRNVVIYFDKETQRRLFDRYADIMAPEGYLFIGHSESLHRVSDRFEHLGKTIYRRIR